MTKHKIQVVTTNHKTLLIAKNLTVQI